MIKTHRDGFPWFSARRARRGDAGGDDATRDLIRSALRAGMAETGFLHDRVTRDAFLAPRRLKRSHREPSWWTRRSSEMVGRRQRLTFGRRFGPAPDGPRMERQFVLAHEGSHVVPAPTQQGIDANEAAFHIDPLLDVG